MKPDWVAPMNAAATRAVGMFTESASTAGARPLITPRFINSFPRSDSLVTPAIAMTDIRAPPPTAPMSRVNPASLAFNLVSDSTGSSDSNDIVSPQWKSAMNTTTLRIGVLYTYLMPSQTLVAKLTMKLLPCRTVPVDLVPILRLCTKLTT